MREWVVCSETACVVLVSVHTVVPPIEVVIRHTAKQEKEESMNIYVGNLAFGVSDDELRREFEAFGQVSSVNIIKDRYSGESKGFGFVEMSTDSEAEAAIAALNGKELKGRTITVNVARPRTDGRRGGGGGGGERKGGGRRF
jgi:cold-inducible RNA-binding protein